MAVQLLARVYALSPEMGESGSSSLAVLEFQLFTTCCATARGDYSLPESCCR